MYFLFGILLWLSAGLILPNPVVADPAAARGATLANACAACHGPEGRSQGAIPSVGGVAAEDCMAALQAVRGEVRKGTVMNRIAKGVDDAEISAMAAYFAGRQGR